MSGPLSESKPSLAPAWHMFRINDFKWSATSGSGDWCLPARSRRHEQETGETYLLLNYLRLTTWPRPDARPGQSAETRSVWCDSISLARLG